MPLHIDRLLETLVRTRASELRCQPGRVPEIYVGSQFKPADFRTLTPSDVSTLIRAVTPDVNQQALAATGSASFCFNFGDTKPFQVQVFTRDNQHVLIIRPA